MMTDTTLTASTTPTVNHGSISTGATGKVLSERIERVNWNRALVDLDAQGWTVLPGLLSSAECDATTRLYGGGAGFRSHVIMQRHGFGRGEYRYFAYPLPNIVQALRTLIYPYLAPLANCWSKRMRQDVSFPLDHAIFLDRCHAAGQRRPTPLLLQYGPDDYNCLHQDVYGEYVFPLQAAVLLSEPGQDFEGGEFVITEQRPRMQTRAAVVPLRKGDVVVFAVNSRPVAGTRGDYQVKLRHGVSCIRAGHRHTLGIIFHDAL
ncbi:2OG-Fe(II) oxygenase [Asticcacaulis sp. YBE204]|uniref:2OG-Fe(II) oxygenase n=1 Tax=Asticcacaulis sp. YBE204 TaxID=1282363 RepID=UPI0003C4087A|nr:2OG-Fe(II) oxygenase [Asticcacaulis sp. YBE204]ESQ79320.1 hypothetical protein AEYBE204_09940 [Asticcacaulis sp. YBE204]